MVLVFSPKSHSVGNANSSSGSCKVNVQLVDLFKVFATKTVGNTTGVSRTRGHIGLNLPLYSKQLLSLQVEGLQGRVRRVSGDADLSAHKEAVGGLGSP